VPGFIDTHSIRPPPACRHLREAIAIAVDRPIQAAIAKRRRDASGRVGPGLQIDDT